MLLCWQVFYSDRKDCLHFRHTCFFFSFFFYFFLQIVNIINPPPYPYPLAQF